MHFITTIVLIALLALCSAQTYKGYYQQTWKATGKQPSGTNIGIAFSGWANPNNAVSDSNGVKGALPNTKYIALGGGNANGRWTSALLSSVNSAINAGSFSGYAGLCYDIEEGDSGLANAFETSFSTAKANGLKVIVTISHAGPYGVSDATAVMNKVLASTNVDFVTPQLYTSGSETSLDYSVGASGFPWSSWKSAKAKILLSIPQSSQWSCGYKWFMDQGFSSSNVVGYIVWNNDDPVGSSPSCSSTSGGTPRKTRCGTDWNNANGKCGTSCSSDAQCGSEHCYADLATISGCNNAAVEETSAMTDTNNMGMSPTVIGLSAALIVVGLALIIVSVFLYKKSVEREERA
jgi:hypothetical protein